MKLYLIFLLLNPLFTMKTSEQIQQEWFKIQNLLERYPLVQALLPQQSQTQIQTLETKLGKLSPETVEKIKEKQFVEESHKRISALTSYILDNKKDQDTIFFTKRITEQFTDYHKETSTPIAKELFADFMSIEFDQEEITLGDLCTAMLEKLEKYNTAYLVSHYKANKAFYKDKNTKVHFLNEIRTSFTCISCISSTKQSREIKAQNAEIAEMNAKIDKIDAKIDAQNAEIAEMNAKIDKIDAKIDAQNAEIKVLMQQFQNLEDEFKKLEKNNAAMLQAFEAQLKTFKTQLKQNEEQIKANGQFNNDVKKILDEVRKKLQSMAKDIEDIKRTSTDTNDRTQNKEREEREQKQGPRGQYAFTLQSSNKTKLKFAAEGVLSINKEDVIYEQGSSFRIPAKATISHFRLILVLRKIG